MLDIIDVSKTFAPGTVNEHIALQNVSLHLDNGEFVTAQTAQENQRCLMCFAAHIFRIRAKLFLMIMI